MSQICLVVSIVSSDPFRLSVSIPFGGGAFTQLFDPGSATPPGSETMRVFNWDYSPSGALNPLLGGFAPSGAAWGPGLAGAIFKFD
jgi:hypothetical protein